METDPVLETLCGRLTKSENSVIQIAKHHRQNPTESNLSY